MSSRPPARLTRLIWGALFALLLAGSQLAAQGPRAWKSGAAFRQQLDQPEGISWQERPLREGLVRLSTAYGIAIFLDRRIDPGTPVSLTLRDQPVGKLLDEIAGRSSAETTTLADVVYIGPPQTASKLATLSAIRRQEVARLPAAARLKLSTSAPWQWEDLAQPRQLLADLARQASVTVQNPDAIPLDLWPAVSLPPLVWSDRMTLLLAGFALTYEIDSRGSSIRIVPIPTDLAVERPRAPQSASRTSPAAKKGGQKKVYTLKVENESAGNVLKTIANSVGKELQYDSSVLEKLKRQVTLNVKDVPLDQLLEATLKPLGLTFILSDGSLEIRETK